MMFGKFLTWQPQERKRETLRSRKQRNPPHRGEGRLTRSKNYFDPARGWYATQRKKKMQQVTLDSIFTAAQSEAVRSKRPPIDNVNTEDVGVKRRNIATTSPSPDQQMQDGTTVADSLVVSSADEEER